MSYSVTFDKNVPHRILFSSYIFDKNSDISKSIQTMMDTGCYNSMIPIKRAMISGTPLGMMRKIVIGANVIDTEAYIIDKLNVGSFTMRNVFMFAGTFKGELADTILLGLNVLNNWKYTVNRKESFLDFEENLPDMIPNKAKPYQNYFDKEGKYVYSQSS